ncbi:acyl--CoA ligase [Amycolatopsis acidicola]|uniref:Acyl--CoA ligase n=1 Tax=Amycolatopsis acidicola TaxID=2596893 RepID=A0A5N0VDN9_9PSEU|nr:class I adenylate-forming enzyme family protein [Amycolatopsis acidicola]KAA9164416.1 acyl--CoA ligase [Amycolatopsis acidicola]
MQALEQPEIKWGREVVRGTVHGRPSLMYKDRPHRVRDLLIGARRWTGRELLVQGERRLTFEQHEQAVAAVANRLAAYGVTKGDRVLLLGFNSIEWVVAFWAVQSLGAVTALGNSWWSDHEVDTLVRKSESKLMISDRELHSVPRVSFAELRSIVDAGDPAVLPEAEVSDEDPAVIMFSSGTTGTPKGILMSQRTIIGNLHNLLAMTRRLPDELPDDYVGTTSLQTVPLFHLAGVQVSCATLLQGGKIVMLNGKFDPAEVLRLIQEEKVKSWGSIPTMVTRVLDYPGLSEWDTSTLKSVPLGGSAVPANLRERIRQAFPNVKGRVGSLYGLTESGGLLAAGAGSEIGDHPGRVGKPLPVVEVRIANPDSEGIGEIMGRTPNVPEGYLGEGPIEDEDGWIATGDLGRIDDEGYLYVTGRVKEVIIRGGENIAAANVENTLLSHPAVADAGVLGVPDKDLGEIVGAVVVPHADAGLPGIEELTQLCKEKLARFEVPERWWIRREQLPMSGIGKIAKRELLQQWTDRGLEDLVDENRP